MPVSPFDVAVDDRGPLVGRGLVAARHLPAGHVVLVDLPALVVPAPDAAHAVCASCLRRLGAEPRGGHLTCPGCCCRRLEAGPPPPTPFGLPIRFCSPECLAARAGPPGFHTPALCLALQAANYQGLPDADAASSLRFVLTAATLRAEAEAGEAPDSRAAAAAAFGALASMTAPEASVARLGAQELALRARGALESAGVRPLTAQEVGQWLAVEEANGFAALSPPPSHAAQARAPPLPRVRGTCFYPLAFLFNHDCLPSVARFDDLDGGGYGAALEAAISRAPGLFLGGHGGPGGLAAAGGGGAGGAEPFRSATPAQRRTALVAVTLHPLPRGEELRLSYVPISWGAAERAGRLAACYGFGCRCARCLGELEAFGGGGGGENGVPSPLDEEAAAAICGAASWARHPSVAERAAREALATALRLASAAARSPPGAPAGASSCASASATPPAAEIGYIRAFLAKFSCPAPRKGGAAERGDDDDDDDDECGGTLAPVAAAATAGGSSSSPSSGFGAAAPPPTPTPTRYQCNSCGFVRSEEDFLRSLAALDDDDGSDYDDDEEEMEDG